MSLMRIAALAIGTSLSLTAVLWSVGYAHGWSDGELGVAMLGAGSVGTALGVYLEDRQRHPRPRR